MIITGLLTCIMTYAATSVIAVYGACKAYVELSEEQGYIIDKNVLDNIRNKKKNKKKSLRDRLQSITFFIPGINMLIASFTRIKLKKVMSSDEELKSSYVKMTDEQRHNLEGKTLREKLEYLIILSEQVSKENRNDFGTDYIIINNDKDEVIINSKPKENKTYIPIKFIDAEFSEVENFDGPRLVK